MKKIRLNLFVVAGLLIFLLSSCSTTGRALLYSESSIAPSEVSMRTVAVLPNRLPVTMQNPEEWRKKNYEIIKEILQKRGCNVVPYETSNMLFQQSGLPLEDTKSSRDKYAELAQKLNADALVFPYYATSFNGNVFSSSYTSIGSLQLYSLAHNDFSTRIDLEGIRKIQQWPALVLPLIGSLFSTILSSEDPGVGLVIGGIMGIVGPLYQVFTFGPAKKAYDVSFKRGLEEGFNVFFERHGQSVYGGHAAQQPVTNGGKYSKYSLEELQTLKKAAIANSDFDKAAEIKEEIETRK
jgi:hypothetical protein